jgi:hypothetical protein
MIKQINMNTKAFIKTKLRESIEESGFPRVRRMMLGDIEGVDTLGILTAENPMGNKLKPSENNERQALLMNDLRSLNLGFIKIKGMYYTPENSLIIPNISKNMLIELSNKYEQESVIFGEKMYKNNFAYMRFYYIEGGQVKNVRNISLSDKSIQNKIDFYSAIKNRKFLIPFFDKLHKHQPPLQSYGSPKITQTSLNPYT